MRGYYYRGRTFRIFGAILLVAGIVMVFSGRGINAANDSDGVFAMSMSTGEKLMLGGYFVAGLGALLLLIGIILFVKSYRNRKTNGAGDDNKAEDVVSQLVGIQTIYDIFHSEDRSSVFCFYRNNTCVLKEGDIVHRGKMDPVTWENDRPTLWRITLDVDGVDKVYEISKVDDDIRVKSDEGTAIFYRN